MAPMRVLLSILDLEMQPAKPGYFSLAVKGTHSIASAGPGTQKIVDINGMELAGSDEYSRYYGYYQEDMEFIECMRYRKLPLANIEEAVKTMHLVDLLVKSRI